ncbi:DNA primase [Mycoplasma procyoni]|uniref:DNA primase n=1 Tax=Mycoplasma procyoni TaxID=568784 RepID=UPI00197BE83F|nr:DNA primase [Mycoplasma procyoni]MBN3534551.1 DNA primase [Mycoplasma procyoni]
MDQTPAHFILENVDIVNTISSFISVKKNGNNYWAICPFHSDTKPSLSISPSKKIFKCFSCNVSGTVIDFIMRYNSWSFIDTLKWFNNTYNLNLDIHENNNQKVVEYTEIQKQIIKANTDASAFFQLNLNTELTKNKELVAFIKKRNFSRETISQFEIGFNGNNEQLKEILLLKKNPVDILMNASLITETENSFFKNRVIFPIKNEYGDIVGFSGRTFLFDDNGPKYLNSAQNQLFSKSNILYNYHFANQNLNSKRELIITEGFMDVIALYKAGIKNAVALMGTALTEHHIPLLKHKKILLMLDGDRAGLEATKKSILTLLRFSINVEIINNPTDLDPDEYLEAHGKDELSRLIADKRISALSFIYNKLSQEVDQNDYLSAQKFSNEFSIYLEFANQDEKNFFIKRAEEDFKINIKISNPHNFNHANNYNFDRNNYPSATQFVAQEKKARTSKQIKEDINFEIRKWTNTLITSVLLLPDIEKLYLSDKSSVKIQDSDKDLIDNLLLVYDTEKRREFLKLKDIYIEEYAKMNSDWTSIKANLLKLNDQKLNLNIIEMIKYYESCLINSENEEEKERYLRQIQVYMAILDKKNKEKKEKRL